MKVLVPIAPGFEEIEAVTIIDILRRAEIDITTAYTDENPVKGSHNISVTADENLQDIDSSHFNMIILPGGMPGSKNLMENSTLLHIVNEISNRGGYTAAICAAPIVLGKAGLLKGKNATCFPGFEKQLTDSNHISSPVVVDGNVITGKGPGCAIDFSLKIVEIIKGADKARELRKGLQVYWT